MSDYQTEWARQKRFVDIWGGNELNMLGDCEWCNGQFKKKMRKQRFCSSQCRGNYKAWLHHDQAQAKNCVHCRNAFISRNRKRIFCSLFCHGQYYATHRAKRKFSDRQKERRAEYNLQWQKNKYRADAEYKKDKKKRAVLYKRGWRKELHEIYLVESIAKRTPLSASDVRKYPQLIQMKKELLLNKRLTNSL